MKVAVVIPNLNGIEFIGDCIDSVKKQSHPAKIIIVDNGSVDGSVKLINSEYPDVEVIKLDRNTGFTGGVNAGIRYAIDNDFKAIALLNNDAIAEKNWLSSLVKVMTSDEKFGVVTGKILRLNGKQIDSCGEEYSIWGMPFPLGRDLGVTDSHFDEPRAIFAASGGASLYRTKMLKHVGLFDQKFFAYYEDVDISFRARLAGWEIFYTPDAIVYHAVGRTSSTMGNFTRYHSTKNFFMLYSKNMPARLFWKYLPLFMIRGLIMGMSSLVKGKIMPFIHGILVFLKYLPKILKERHQIQRSRIVTIKSIDKLLYHRYPPR